MFFAQEEEEQIIDKDEELTIKAILQTKQFWHLYVMFTFSLTFGMFFQGSVKSYTSNFVRDD